jgi:hypothetical protein
MRDDPVVTDLVTTARNGDKQAWDALVERYAPLVWSIRASSSFCPRLPGLNWVAVRSHSYYRLGGDHIWLRS